MVTGYSRWLSAVLVPTRSAEDLFAGWWQLISALGAVLRTLVWDGEGAVSRHRYGRSELTADCQAFRGVLGAKVIILKRQSRNTKGSIERAHDYLETSFLPGRSFAGPDDFNATAGLDPHGEHPSATGIGCAPTDRIGADRQAMLALPPVPPATGLRASGRLPRDHYARLDSNDYSVHLTAVGRRIETITDLQRVRVLFEGRTVADHQRVWAWHQTITDQDHLDAANRFRRDHDSILRPVREDRPTRRRSSNAS